MKAKKGDIWISAVLYLTLGVIAIALILAAAIPFINKIRDRNTLAQTKEVLFALDETIHRVATEGPGSQRELSPFTIGSGKLIIDQDRDIIRWEMETQAIIQEPNTPLQEGALTVLLQEDPNIEGRYKMILEAPYPGIDINLTSSYNNPFTGKFSVLVKHSGRIHGNKPEIEIHIN